MKTRTRGRGGAQGGFTLIELLLVLAILATLAALVIPKLAGRSEQASETAARTEIATMSTALDAFEIDNGYYPSGSDGLFALVDAPAEARNWRGPYLNKDIPSDPWGSEYVYEYPGQLSQYGYDLYSIGPDKRGGTEDDIGNWMGRETR